MTSLLSPTEPIEHRQLLHDIHRGDDIDDSPFPVMPDGVGRCVKCHGSDTWKVPTNRSYPGSANSARVWGVVCGSCHNSAAAGVHITSQTDASGAEACDLCHGPSGDQDVVKVHFPH